MGKTRMTQNTTTYDVAIIGAGICGSSIARELSRTDAAVCLIEKESDVSAGTSKANSGIVHAGYDPVPGTLMAKYNIEGSRLFGQWAKELHFDYKQIGSLVLGFNEEDKAHLQKLYDRGIKNGVKDMRILDQAELRALEGNINEDAVCALYAPSAAIIAPYQTTWAIAEGAVQNGVTLLRNTTVHAIKKEADKIFSLTTSAGTIRARFVVNAAGLHADSISRMAGARDFTIVQKRGEYCLLDSNCRSLVNHVLFQCPDQNGKGVLVTQTVDGNILIGPSADAVSEAAKDYTGTSSVSQETVLKAASKTIPLIPRRNIINSFAGLRAIAYEKDSEGKLVPLNDFIVEEDKKVSAFFNIAGICSPGLTSAPAIAQDIVRMLQKAGLNAKENKNFVAERKGIPCFSRASNEEKKALIAQDSRFGQIICRCEMITEGEIVAAIHSTVGATDLDGVKRRTRAGMGRCQAGFCSPRVTEILSRELGIPMTGVTKNGGVSYILDSKTRDTVPDIFDQDKEVRS